MALLTVSDLGIRFGGLSVLDRVSLQVEPGTIHGLIGPNGSGKTTLFNVITGYYKPNAGRVIFRGQTISGLSPHLIARKRIGRTFQNMNLFHKMTALETVMVGLHSRTSMEVLDLFFRPRSAAAEEAEISRVSHKWLEFVGLSDLKDERVSNLAYGQQRLVEVARTLAMEPELLMLDEPAAGLNDSESANLVRLVYQLRDLGHTILIVDHDMKVIMGICDRITVLDHGQKIAEGNPAEVRSNAQVIAAYLGEPHENRREALIP